MEKCAPCKFNEKKSVSKFKCLDCSESYCEQCKEDHIKFGAFQNHIIKILDVPPLYDYAYPNVDFPKIPTKHLDKPTGTIVENNNVKWEVNDSPKTGHPLYRHTAVMNDDNYLSFKALPLTKNTTDNAPTIKTVTIIDTQRTNKTNSGYERPVKTKNTSVTIVEFVVQAEENEFSRKIGINGQMLQIRVSLEAISFVYGSAIVFKCHYHTIRSYTVDKESVILKLGRNCQFGEGDLYMTHNHSYMDIRQALIVATKNLGHDLVFK